MRGENRHRYDRVQCCHDSFILMSTPGKQLMTMIALPLFRHWGFAFRGVSAEMLRSWRGPDRKPDIPKPWVNEPSSTLWAAASQPLLHYIAGSTKRYLER